MNVDVDDRVSADLTANQESVFQVIASDPSMSLKDIADTYDCKPYRVQAEVRTLESQDLIRKVPESLYGDLKWEITEVGRLRLLKFKTLARFDKMEAMVKDQEPKDIDLLEAKRKCFEAAYLKCKELFEDD